MKKLLTTALLLILCLPLLACFSNVQASTDVSGAIRTNTTWRQSASPYKLTGSIAILSGVTLTIEAGVTVDFGSYYMQVNGTLRAQGTENNRIVFKGNNGQQSQNAEVQFTGSSVSWNNQTQTGCILQNVLFDKAVISASDGCSPLIANNIFRGQSWVIIWAKLASPTITGNIFENVNYEGVSASQSTVVTNNLFNKTTWMATAIVGHDNAYIANNVIIGLYRGINGGKTVTNNVILDCADVGISESREIKANYIANNKVGVESSGIIEGNTIVNNDIGIKVWSATIDNNNIANNNRSLQVTGSSNVNVTNNWWGTTNTDQIKGSIWDYNKDYNLGTATFEPILSRPNSEAPSSSTIGENLNLVGSSFEYFNYQLEADILTLTQSVVTVIVICWAVIAVVLVIRRVKWKRA